MSECLFIGDNDSIFSLYSVINQRDFNIETAQAYNIIHALDEIQKNSFDFIILCLPQIDLEQFFEHLEKNELVIPVLFTADNQTFHKLYNKIPYHALCSKISYAADDRVISKTIKKLIKISNRKILENEGYYSLPISFFLNMKKAPCDIYIQLSEKKYVRLFKTDNSIEKERVNKYEVKKCENLFVKTSDYLFISQMFLKEVTKKIELDKMNINLLNNLGKFTHNSVFKLVQEIGINEDVLALAEKSIDYVQKAVSKNSTLSDYLNGLIKRKNYISEHTMLLIYLASAMAREMDWGSDQILDKISFAGFFHDICVNEFDEDLCFVENYDMSVTASLSKRESEYLKHPQMAIDLLNELDGIPQDVERIILMHHEKPDGSGFPSGREWKNIDPLVAVFIMAEEVVNSIYLAGTDKFFIDDIVADIGERYNKGHFRKVFIALKGALALPLSLEASNELSKDRKKIA